MIKKIMFSSEMLLRFHLAFLHDSVNWWWWWWWLLNQMDQVRGKGWLGRSLVKAACVNAAAPRYHNSSLFNRRPQLHSVPRPPCWRRHHHQASRRYRTFRIDIATLTPILSVRCSDVIALSIKPRRHVGGRVSYNVNIWNSYAKVIADRVFPHTTVCKHTLVTLLQNCIPTTWWRYLLYTEWRRCCRNHPLWSVYRNAS